MKESAPQRECVRADTLDIHTALQRDDVAELCAKARESSRETAKGRERSANDGEVTTRDEAAGDSLEGGSAQKFGRKMRRSAVLERA